MSVADQINRIKTNIANTYTAAQAKGATMPQTQNSDNLATCVQSITTGGGGGSTQFGLTAEQMLGTVNEYGTLSVPALPSITFNSVKFLSNSALYYKFYGCEFEPGSEVVFPDLIDVDSPTAITSCFRDTTGLEKASFPALKSLGNNSFQYVFADSEIKSVSFPALTTVYSQAMISCFSGCEKLTEVNFPVLSTLSYSSSLSSTFKGCIALTTISFPALTDVQTNSFGTASYNYCFNGCTALTEIHFRADAQTAIEAMTGYADKFGASSSTIYFDL